jgi:hypothetical protein
VLDDLELAHAVAHRPARVVVGLQLVRIGRRLVEDREALRTVAGGDVGVEPAARRQLLLAVVGVVLLAVVDVEVDVVGVCLPGEHEAQRPPRVERNAGALEPLEHLVAPVGLLVQPRRRDEPEILAQDLIDAGEATLRIAALRPFGDHVERLGDAVLPHQREREQSMARRMIRPLRARLLVGVDGQRQAIFPEALETFAGEASQIGAAGKEIHD